MGGQGLFQELGELLAVAIQRAWVHGPQGVGELLAGGVIQLLDGFFPQHVVNARGAGLEVEPQGALDGDAAVAEGVDGEDFALGGFLEGAIEAYQLVDLLGGDVLALAAQGFAHLGKVLAAVDELHLAPALGGLVVGQ